MSEWKEYKLGEIAEILDFKRKPLSSIERAARKGKYPYYGASDIIDYLDDYIFEGEHVLISEDGENLRSRQTPIAFLADGQFWVNNHAHIVKSDYIHNRLICYYFANLDLNPYITGAVQPKLSQDSLNRIPIYLPESMVEREKIVSILSSLDDKIDLLNRENVTLEAMAEALFRQWFIEEAKEDWDVKPLSSYGKIVCGKTPPKNESRYFGGDIPFIKIPDMHGKTFIFESEDSLTREGQNFQKEKTLPPFSIIVSCIATVGLVALNAKEAQTNQQINSIIPYREEDRYFLYLQLKNMYEELNAMASGGTATLNLNTKNFSNISIACPNEDTCHSFHRLVEPLFEKIYCNQKQMITLAKQRNMLLPKLMSNEITI
ncbi:MAG: restriction endonuclease subunit S [Prevotella sp.]|nr:restriction endonuclease subunit S [Prevotella sp.]